MRGSGANWVSESIDPLTSHKEWAADIKETQGHALNFPLIGDHDKKVANLYGMIHPNASDTATVRSVFVIGPDKKLKLELGPSLSGVRKWGDQQAGLLRDAWSGARVPTHSLAHEVIATAPGLKAFEPRG